MSSFEDIVDSYYQPIYRFCYHLLANQAEAEDATQECFLKAYKYIENLRDEKLIKAWLYQISRNVCIDKQRGFSKFKSFLKSYITFEESLPIESDHLILKLVAKLPKQQAEIFILRQLHDFSTEETAKIVGVTEGTVKSQLSRAVNFLKHELKESGFFDN